MRDIFSLKSVVISVIKYYGILWRQNVKIRQKTLSVNQIIYTKLITFPEVHAILITLVLPPSLSLSLSLSLHRIKWHLVLNGTLPRFPSPFIISKIKIRPTEEIVKARPFRRRDLHSSAFVMILMMMMAKWTVWFLCGELVIKNQYYIKGVTLVIKDFSHSGYSS